MSWCDKLASVPAVGFRLEPHFALGGEVVKSLSPLIDQWVDGDKPGFSLQEQRNQFSTQFGTNEGMVYGVDPFKVFVEFKHQLRIKSVSGGLPVAELLSEPQPYTKLLPVVAKRLIEATLMLPNPPNRMLNRIGIISSTTVEEEEIPPGISRMIKYLGKPWGGELDSLGVAITANLDDQPNYTDRCIHSITVPEDAEELVQIKFDFQRSFQSGRALNEQILSEEFSAVQERALEYFEELAEGNRFDEQLIDKPT